MPLPRFEKLTTEKQEEILDAAAAEFATSGFEGASIAAIVERAGASKSAVYYYFADKVDLYGTVLRRSLARADASVGEFPWAALAEGDFWQEMGNHLHRLHAYFLDQPYDVALWRSAIKADEATELARLKREMEAGYQERWIRALSIGQTRGAVRGDIPLEVAHAMSEAAHGVLDRNFEQVHGVETEAVTPELMAVHARLVIATMRRLLAPEELS